MPIIITLAIILLVGSLCALAGFIAYWRGVNATEQRLKPLLAAREEYIEELLDDRRARLMTSEQVSLDLGEAK